MIEFLCGRAGSGKSACVMEKMRAALAAGRRRVILLIPEQQAVVWESRIARQLPPSAAFSLEIVNFRRLCNLVARQYGGLSANPITRGGKTALMWGALRSLGDSLTVYGKGKRMDRAIPSLLSAVSEMKRYGVTPAALSEAAEHLDAQGESAQLCARARDLALLSAVYSRMVTERYDDDEDALAHLAQRLAREPFFAGADVFVDSFFSLTPVENEILYQIFRQADAVTVTFACPAQPTEEAQFAPPRSFLSAMKRAADRAGKPYCVTELSGNHRAETAQLAYLEKHLWDFAADPYTVGAAGDLPDVPESLRVIRTADRYAEAETVAARIQSLVRAGARYSEIAIIARDASALRGILDTALARHGIPYDFSERSDISARPAARLLLSALRVVGGGWQREDVMLCVKTGLCGLEDDECDALELYTETWHIRGMQSFQQDWNMNPDGYVPKWTERAKRRLAAANAAREKLAVPMTRFSETFQTGDAPVSEISRAIYELLCEFHVWDALADRADALSAAGRRREAAEERQLWDILMDALDTLVDTLGDARADAGTFASLLKQVLAEADVGSIPGGMDEVTVGSAGQVRLGETDHILLVGAIEGEFPAAPEENGFFSDADKICLEGEGILLSSRTDERMQEELLWFYRAAALPHRSLTVLVPESNGGTPTTPSLALERILTLFPDLPLENSAAWEAAAWIFRPSDVEANARLLRRTAAGDALETFGALSPVATGMPLSAVGETVSDETAAMLFPREIGMTQTRLDSFILCRFGYYCRFVAQLEEKHRAELGAVNVGTFVHRVFELFFARVKQAEWSLPLSEEQLTETTDAVVAQVVSEICPSDEKRGRAAYLFLRLKRCVLPMLSSLSREFAQSEFRPAFFELPVGGGEALSVPPLRVRTAGGRSVYLRGTMDRLDTFRRDDTTYVRVVDYKTGAKKFSAEDVSLGLNAQLLIYLFSVLHAPPGEFRRQLCGGENGKIEAAGALYFSARPGETQSDVPLSRESARNLAEESIARSGVLLRDETVLRAMEADLGGQFIPVKAKKDGTLSGGAACSVSSREELEEWENTLRDAIARTGDALVSGQAQAEPLCRHHESPCRFCSVRAICRAAKDGEEGES